MLSDEEKKAYDDIKRELTDVDRREYMNKWFADDLQILVNLIEKQSKEIEELKKYEKYYEEMEEVNKKFIAVDKIKAEIEELQEDIKYSANPLSIDNSKFGIKVLQSLLKEE